MRLITDILLQMQPIYIILLALCWISRLFSQDIELILSSLDSSKDYAQQAKAEKELFQIIAQSAYLIESAPSSWIVHKNKLIQFLQDKETSLNKKIYILRILGKFGGASVIDAIEPILYLQNEQLKEEARQAIIYIGGDRAKQCFRVAFKQVPISQKEPFLEALVALSDRSFSEELTPYISSSHESLSIQVIEVLGTLGNPWEPLGTLLLALYCGRGTCRVMKLKSNASHLHLLKWVPTKIPSQSFFLRVLTLLSNVWHLNNC